MSVARDKRSRFLMPARWRGVGERVDRCTGGMWTLIESTFANYRRHNCNMRSAAIAYYILLSFFPTVVLLVVLASSFLTQSRTQETVFAFVDRYLPGADQLVQLNIEKLLRNRGWASVLSTLGLFWSGSNVFANIHRSLDDIWNVRERPSFWWQRLLGFASIGAILSLFVLSLATTALGRLISRLPELTLGLIPVEYGQLWGRVTVWIGAAPTVLLFFAIYRLLSTAPLRWWELVPGSIVAALLWEIAKQGFTRYVTTFEPYNLVYGSLGKFIAFIIWSYTTAAILLLGAELAVAWRHVRGVRQGCPGLIRAWLEASVRRKTKASL
jgi:membrane protein